MLLTILTHFLKWCELDGLNFLKSLIFKGKSSMCFWNSLNNKKNHFLKRYKKKIKYNL